MDRKIRVAAIGDNCIDYYDSLNESYPGGNPVNVAVYIKRLGGESSYTGAVGTDSFGKIMISAIQNKGVDTSHVQVLDGKTAVTHVDIVDGDRVFGKYEEGVLADFKLREQDISFIKKHDLAVTGIWGMIEDELPLYSDPSYIVLYIFPALLNSAAIGYSQSSSLPGGISVLCFLFLFPEVLQNSLKHRRSTSRHG